MAGSEDDPSTDDMTALAERFFDLWREQMALIADDPATAQAMADMARFWQPMMTGGWMDPSGFPGGNGAAGGPSGGGAGAGAAAWPGFGAGLGGFPPNAQDAMQDMARWADQAHMRETMRMMQSMLGGMAAGGRGNGATGHGSHAGPRTGSDPAGSSGGAAGADRAGASDGAATASAASDDRDRRLDEFDRRFDRLEERLDSLASELARGSGEFAPGHKKAGGRKAAVKRAGAKKSAARRSESPGRRGG